MLKVIKSMSELCYEQLLSVYSESVQGHEGKVAFLSYIQDDFFQRKDACYCLLVVDDTYKSALRLEPYRDGLLLQALETEPSARKMGYGFSLVKSVLEYFSGTTYKCIYSHVKKSNVASLKLHRKCGFQTVSDTAVLLDDTVTANYYTLCYYL